MPQGSNKGTAMAAESLPLSCFHKWGRRHGSTCVASLGHLHISSSHLSYAQSHRTLFLLPLVSVAHSPSLFLFPWFTQY